MTKERTRTINTLTALVRTVDLGVDARRALTARQITTIAGWRDRDEDTTTATCRREAVRLARRVHTLNAPHGRCGDFLGIGEPADQLVDDLLGSVLPRHSHLARRRPVSARTAWRRIPHAASSRAGSVPLRRLACMCRTEAIRAATTSSHSDVTPMAAPYRSASIRLRSACADRIHGATLSSPTHTAPARSAKRVRARARSSAAIRVRSGIMCATHAVQSQEPNAPSKSA